MQASTTNHWPKQFQDQYEPIRKLGMGAFGMVVLGKPKRRSSLSQTDNRNADRLVAIKLVGRTSNPSEVAYARRERDILTKLHHPNIIQCYDYAEPPTTSMNNIGMVLSYAKGPTLSALLQQGGALSTGCGLTIFSQLVDAISYLHAQDIIHRDIKPDNVIVVGADFDQDDIWKNPKSIGTGNSPSTTNTPHVIQGMEWTDLRRRWKPILVDFGFAREIQSQVSERNHFKMETIYEIHTEEEVPGLLIQDDGSSSSSSHTDVAPSEPATENTPYPSRKAYHRSMTALGTKQYAAPEIFRKIKRTSAISEASEERAVQKEEIIGDYTSSYGMLVDAYALGFLLRYMMTGVPPEKSIVAALSREKSPGKRVVRWLSSHIWSPSTNKLRHKHYRSVAELPVFIKECMKTLTEIDETKRLSVEEVRQKPLVMEILSF